MKVAVPSSKLSQSTFLKANPVQVKGVELRTNGSRSLRVACEAGSSVIERPWKTNDCRLVLEDGSVWKGTSFGARGTKTGEVVFNTSLTGYQEILTDPSYAGQFVLMTCPHIGNTGVNPEDEESNSCYTPGLIVRSISNSVSNWRAKQTLPDYLKQNNSMGISDVDTRAITKRLREKGSLNGVLTTDGSISDSELVEMAKNFEIVGKDMITGVTTEKEFLWFNPTTEEWEFSLTVPERSKDRLRIVAYDFGVKHNILRRLAAYGCEIVVMPSTTPVETVLKEDCDGFLFSNGPGDPSAVPYAVENVKAIINESQRPIMGICMGHQLLGQALGGKTFKMKFGHHGGNHPVRHLPTGRVEISAQNHNYAVDTSTLPASVKVTHINLNDGTCAGFKDEERGIISIQYHPEASPGPHDSDTAFYDFVEMLKARKVAA